MVYNLSTFFTSPPTSKKTICGGFLNAGRGVGDIHIEKAQLE